MERREFFSLAGLATLAAAAGGGAAHAGQATPDTASLIHIYNTPDGESHLTVRPIAEAAKALPVQSMTANPYRPGTPNWHVAPQPQFAINMTGELEVEVSTGTKRRIGPGDLVFLEDTTGKGHITRPLGPVTNLFIRPPPGFNLRAWASGA